MWWNSLAIEESELKPSSMVRSGHFPSGDANKVPSELLRKRNAVVHYGAVSNLSIPLM